MDSTHQKQTKIRNAEYYDMIEIFDKLYKDSQDNIEFTKLMKIISSENNILLAYRNIKKNSGSMTAGTDKRTIKDLEKLSTNELIQMVQKSFKHYIPKSVKRVEIPKPNGDKRPLGIPCIIDRLMQQCILQVLEPICEAKFYERSNGFRPNRSAENAIAQTYKMIQTQNLFYVINIDIKSFFDNVNHSKLIKQIWNLGIKDKQLLSIIKEMLKAPIIMPDNSKIIPSKGTPQGGILSPLLSNIVLNELDYWIASQWEEFPSEIDYKGRIRHGVKDKGHMYRALRKTKLKEMYIIRYADDFKIFCRTKEDSEKVFYAVKQWLKDRLDLEINVDKSNIADVRNKSFEFLGFEVKAIKKGDKFVVESHMCDKAIERCIKELKEKIIDISKSKHNDEIYEKVSLYNSTVWGIHNYYKIATHINKDCAKIAYRINLIMYNRLKDRLSKNGNLKEGYIKQKYGKSEELRYVNGYPITPIHYIQTQYPKFKEHDICKYTKEGREKIYKNLSINTRILKILSIPKTSRETIEFIDNRISLYCAQHGKCAITGEFLEIDDIHCHHKIAKKDGGTDSYSNLIIIHKNIHILLHATKDETIKKYIEIINPTPIMLKKINELREKLMLNKIIES